MTRRWLAALVGRDGCLAVSFFGLGMLAGLIFAMSLVASTICRGQM